MRDIPAWQYATAVPSLDGPAQIAVSGLLLQIAVLTDGSAGDLPGSPTGVDRGVPLALGLVAR